MLLFHFASLALAGSYKENTGFELLVFPVVIRLLNLLVAFVEYSEH